MYDGNIVLLAFFLGMFFSLYAEQVIRSVVYAVVSFVMGLPTKHAPDDGYCRAWWHLITFQDGDGWRCFTCPRPRR